MNVKKIAAAAASAAVLAAGAVVVTPTAAQAAGCEWYIYKTTRDTTYWQYSSGNTVNFGDWRHPDKNTLLKTNVPFNGRNRTVIKYEHAWGEWKWLSLTGDYPYINRGAVEFMYCY